MTKLLWTNKPPSAEEVAAAKSAEEAAAQAAEAAQLKIAGIEFDGVMCSATKEDRDGLAAVLLSIQLQGAAFKPTIFHFANGSKLVISLDNYQAFAAVWLPFRQSFFTA